MSLSFLFLVEIALGAEEELDFMVSEESVSGVRGEPTGDEATTGVASMALRTGVKTGTKAARSSAAQAELKVLRPFAFLAGGSSFGSCKAIAAFEALILVL